MSPISSLSALTLSLQLNSSKSEIISSNTLTISTLLSSLPGTKEVEPSANILLGSPIRYLTSVSVAVNYTVALLRCLGDRLEILNSHDALVLLRYTPIFANENAQETVIVAVLLRFRISVHCSYSYYYFFVISASALMQTPPAYLQQRGQPADGDGGGGGGRGGHE